MNQETDRCASGAWASPCREERPSQNGGGGKWRLSGVTVQVRRGVGGAEGPLAGGQPGDALRRQREALQAVGAAHRIAARRPLAEGLAKSASKSGGPESTKS